MSLTADEIELYVLETLGDAIEVCTRAGSLPILVVSLVPGTATPRAIVHWLSAVPNDEQTMALLQFLVEHQEDRNQIDITAKIAAGDNSWRHQGG
jgi:hypothetical protein